MRKINIQEIAGKSLKWSFDITEDFIESQQFPEINLGPLLPEYNDIVFSICSEPDLMNSYWMVGIQKKNGEGNGMGIRN